MEVKVGNIDSGSEVQMPNGLKKEFFQMFFTLAGL